MQILPDNIERMSGVSYQQPRMSNQVIHHVQNPEVIHMQQPNFNARASGLSNSNMNMQMQPPGLRMSNVSYHSNQGMDFSRNPNPGMVGMGGGSMGGNNPLMFNYSKQSHYN